MLRLWMRIFLGVLVALVLQYTTATLILGENDLDSYELAGFTISNGFVYQGLVREHGGMRDKESLGQVLESLHIPLCNLHIASALPVPPDQATPIPIDENPDFDWEALCEEHELLKLTVSDHPQLPTAYLFFIDEQRPIVAFQTDDGQAWLGIDPVGDEPGTTDWSELIPFIGLNACIAIALAWFVTGSLARRINRLSMLSEEFAQGNLSLRSSDEGGDSIGVLGTNFNAMADSLQRVIEDQRDLLRAVAHELRTPLARIGVAIGIAEIKYPAVEKQMLSMQEDLQELEGLIAEITEYLRLEHGQDLKKEQLNLEEISQQVLTSELQSFNHIHVSLVAQTKATVFVGHRNSMQRCLSNIVRNAARYAKESLRVSITESDRDLTIMVEDDGPGFPQNMLDELTTAFVTTADGRLGLGLALCRRIIELSGGSLLLINSTSLGGACVQVNLPLRHESYRAVE